jgi:hypothetical protein
VKKIMAIVLLVSSTSTLITAAENYDTKAFRTFTKLCTSCHGTPFYASKQIDDDDWKFYFEKDEKLLSIHKNEPKAIKSLKSPLFKKRKKRLLKFLVNNSKYSGKVNGCDANFCGTNH